MEPELNQKHSKLVLGDVHPVKQQSSCKRDSNNQFSFFSRFLKEKEEVGSLGIHNKNKCGAGKKLRAELDWILGKTPSL